MPSFQEIIANIRNATPPPRHMTTGLSSDELAKVPKGINLDRLLDACEAAGRNPMEIIALALSDEAREQRDQTGMTLREQSRLSWQIVDKAVPTKKALDIDANVKGTLNIAIVRFSDPDPASVAAAPLPDGDVASPGAGL